MPIDEDECGTNTRRVITDITAEVTPYAERKRVRSLSVADARSRKDEQWLAAELDRLKV